MRKDFDKKIFTRLYMLLTVLATGGFLAGCKSDKEAVIREKVAERVAAVKARKEMECRSMLLEEAGKIVDSLLLEEAMGELADSLLRQKPFRPGRPPAMPAIDSSPVAPFFER